MAESLSSKFFCFFIFFATAFSPIYVVEHFEHYRNLLLQAEISSIKEIITENKEYIPRESYVLLIHHIDISQKLLNEVYD